MSTGQTVDRRRFLHVSALGAAVGLSRWWGGTALAETEQGGVSEGFLHKKADVKQIWDFTTIDKVQTGVGAMMNAMNSFQFSYHKTHYLLINLRGPSAVIFALDDAMWVKYQLGAKYQIFDPTTPGAVAQRNVFYARHNTDTGSLPPSDPKSLYEDASLHALQLRGAHISVCQAALGGQAVQAVADQRANGLTAAEVLQDLIQHLVPGAKVTPTGSSLIGIAQQLGFTYATQ